MTLRKREPIDGPEFIARAEWSPDGWWAYVDRVGYFTGFWRGARLTRWGALFAAKRRAAVLNGDADGWAVWTATALVVGSSVAMAVLVQWLGWTR